MPYGRLLLTCGLIAVLTPALAAAQDTGQAPGVGILAYTPLLTACGALIMAAMSFIIAVYNGKRTARLEQDKAEAARRLHEDKVAADERLKRLETNLSIERTYMDARTRYEWEARQRLLEQLEPVLFQTGEVMEQTVARLLNLARYAREGKLGSSRETWLQGADPEDFAITTTFRMIRPVACLRLAEDKITRVDFSLDREIQFFFVLAKIYRELLTNPFGLCRQAPAIDYDFVHHDPNRQNYPAENDPIRRVQHIYSEQMDAACDALMSCHTDGRLVLKRYGDLRAELADPASATSGRLEPALFLWRGVSPRTRPVQWRVGLACALIGKVMLDMLAMRGTTAGTETAPFAEHFAAAAADRWTEALYWDDTAQGRIALRAELDACATNLRERLENPLAHIRLIQPS